MGQPRILGAAAVTLLAVIAAVLLTRNRGTAVNSQGTGHARIASITPAGTDLVIGIGAGDELVGVSKFDDDREGTSGKPRIGDYEGIDWEKLAPLRPNILLVQYGADRIPAGIMERCGDLGIRALNLKLNTLADIEGAMTTIGDAIEEPAQARAAVGALEEKLDAVRARVAGRGRVRAVVATDDAGLGLVGPGGFLDELLTIAGGENAAAKLGKPYVSVDREMMMSLAPEVVIRLEPDGEKKPQVMAEGDRVWNSMAGLPAIRKHRVYVMTEWYAELPGFRVGELAGKFADILHPETKSPGRQEAP